MTAMSDYLENEILDHIFQGAGGAWTAPTTVYVALFDGTASIANLEAGTLTGEISTTGTAYARQPYGAGAAASGSASNAADINFPTATAAWGTVTYAALMDGSTAGAGNVLFAGALSVAKTVNLADTFKFLANQLITNID